MSLFAHTVARLFPPHPNTNARKISHSRGVTGQALHAQRPPARRQPGLLQCRGSLPRHDPHQLVSCRRPSALEVVRSLAAAALVPTCKRKRSMNASHQPRSHAGAGWPRGGRGGACGPGVCWRSAAAAEAVGRIPARLPTVACWAVAAPPSPQQRKAVRAEGSGASSWAVDRGRCRAQGGCAQGGYWWLGRSLLWASAAHAGSIAAAAPGQLPRHPTAPQAMREGNLSFASHQAAA